MPGKANQVERWEPFELTLNGPQESDCNPFIDILWWSKAGVLYGQSPQRIAFLRQILEQSPAGGLDPVETVNRDYFLCAGKAGQYYLTYTGVHSPAQLSFAMPPGKYRIELIDTWDMRVFILSDTYEGTFTIDMPGKPYMAVRLQKVP